MQNVTRRKRNKMPAARPTNRAPDAPKDINVAFRRHLNNPDDTMLEEQPWRQTGVGGISYDWGGDDEDSMSEGEVELDDKKPSEPRMFHIREYESPGRKVSRDVRVVNQGNPNTDQPQTADVVPHFLLPNNSGERESHIPVPNKVTDRTSHLTVPNKGPNRPSKKPVANNRGEEQPYAEVNDRNSSDPQTFHLREYESPGRKISRDVRVVNQGHPNSNDRYEAELVPHLLLPKYNGDRTSHLSTPDSGTNGMSHLQIPNDRGEGPLSPGVNGRKPNDSHMFHIREYESPGRKISRDVRVVNQGSPDRDQSHTADLVPHLLLPHKSGERKSRLPVPNKRSDLQANAPLSPGVVERKTNEPQKFHIREYASPGRKVSRDVHVVDQGHPNSDNRYEAEIVPHILLPTNGGDMMSHLQVPDSETNWTSQHMPDNEPIMATYLPTGGTYGTEHIPSGETQSDHTTVHIRQFQGPQRKISYDVKVENSRGSRDEGYGTEGPQNQLQYDSGQPPGRSGPSDRVTNQSSGLYPSHGQGQSVGQGKRSPPRVHSTNTQQHQVYKSDFVLSDVQRQGESQCQGQSPPVRHQGPVQGKEEEPSGAISDRTLYLDTSRTNNSLPQSTFNRKLEDYYNLDQPRGSIVDPRSFQDAKRASRASVLSKAESLLKYRRMDVLNENSSEDEVQFPPKSKPRRRGSPFKKGGHSTDTEVNRKAKLREKTLTSPEYESMPSPRLSKSKKTVPKRTPFVPKRAPIVPKRQTFMKKGPVKKKAEDLVSPEEENQYEDIQIPLAKEHTDEEAKKVENDLSEPVTPKKDLSDKIQPSDKEESIKDSAKENTETKDKHKTMPIKKENSKRRITSRGYSKVNFGKTEKSKVAEKRRRSSHADYNESPQSQKSTARTVNGKIPYRNVDPRNAPEPLNSFRHNDFVKLDRDYLKDFPELERQVNSRRNPFGNGNDSPFRAGSVVMPVSEYNEAMRVPWEEKGVDLDLAPLRTRFPYSEPVPHRDYRKYRDGPGSDGNRSVPLLSREGSLAPSDFSMPYSEPYAGHRVRRTRRGKSRKRRYVYVPSRDDAIIELVEESQRSDSETPDDRPRRSHAKPPRDYRRSRKHKSRIPVKTKSRRSSSTDSEELRNSEFMPRRNSKRNHRSVKELGKETRHKSRQSSSSQSRPKKESVPRDSSKHRDKKQPKTRDIKPINHNRYVTTPPRESPLSGKGTRQTQNRAARKPVKRHERSGFVNKDNSIQFAEQYNVNKKRGSHFNEHDEIQEESESVDSSTEEEDDTDTEPESEPPQQVSDGEDDPGTTEGDVTARKGRPKGGGRFEDAADGASSTYTELRPGPKQQAHLLQGKRGAFYNFKEKSSPAAIESVNRQRFPTFDSLLDLLTDRLQIEKGANYIYQWPSCARIQSVDDVESYGTYIVASSAMKKSSIEAVYGKLGPKQWHSGKVKHNDSPLIRKPPSGQDSPSNMSGMKKKPMIVTLVCNSTGKYNKVILNTNAHFEDLMAGQITDSVRLDQPPATTLYAFNDEIVGAEVRSLSQLVRDYRNYDTFLVCGKESLPSPISYSSDSYRPPLRHRHRYPPGADSAPPRVDIAQINGDTSPRSSGVHNGLQPLDRQVVKIQGRRRGMPLAPEHEFYSSTVYDGDDEPGKPNRKLMLDWVYGYRGSDRHRNLGILDTNELIYFVASVVVIYDRQKHLQRFYTGHNEDITCLTVHPTQNRVATGQIQGKGSDHGAHIRVWDVDSLTTLSVIGLGVFQTGIISISFSDNVFQQVETELMMVIDESFRHTMSIWDLQTERLITKTTTSTEAVTGGCFYPYEDDIILITYGRQHLYFWRLAWENGRKIFRDKLSGYLEGQDKEKPESKQTKNKPKKNKKDEVPTHFTAVSFSTTGDVITGDSNGSIMIWQRDYDNVFTLSRQDSEFNLHQNAVTAVVPFGDGMMLSGGGSEIYLWDVGNRYRNPQKIPIGITGNIQALVPSNVQYEDGIIYVGTDKNCIFEGYLNHKFSPLVQGHSGESACIAVHPTEPAFITAGKGLVFKWSASCHMCIWKTKLEGEKCTAVAIDPRDRMVALGTKSGKVTLLNYTNRGREENTVVIGAKKINSVSFSPDGYRLAIAVDDGYLHICSVEKGTIGRVHTTSNVQGLSMTNIDWSIDCRYLQTSSTDFQVFFWNAEKKPKVIPGHKLKDADWVTHKSLVSGAILGPWQHLDAGETIKSVDRSNSNYIQKDLLVTGDSMGRLRLYKYPCPSPESEYRGAKGYSGAVNSAVFSGDDIFVFSSASTVSNGELKTHLGIMQWAVVDADAQVLPDHHYPDFCTHNYPHHHNSHYNYNYPNHHKHYPNHHYPHPHIHPHQRPHYPNPYYPPHHPYYKRYQ